MYLLKAAYGVIFEDSSGLPEYGPSSTSSACGPMSAILPTFLKSTGSTAPSFLRSTGVFAAISAARALFAGELTIEAGYLVYGTIGSGSNSPVRKRMVSIFTRARSMSAMVMRPFSRDSMAYLWYMLPQSESTPALRP